MQQASAPNIDEGVIEVIKALIEDWGVEEDVTMKSRLVADLGFESIDIIQLVVALEGRFNCRGIGFDRLLMAGGRYVDDLSLEQIAGFLKNSLK